jgi:hypothetical protein
LERDYEVLVNWLDELAARGLSEALRLEAVEKTTGDAFERLGQRVRSRSAARRRSSGCVAFETTCSAPTRGNGSTCCTAP